MRAHITKAELELENAKKWKMGRSNTVKAKQVEKVLEQFKLKLKQQ